MILFYDTETTGFPNGKLPLNEQPRIVQLGAILDFEDGREAMRLDFIIRHTDLPRSVMESWVGKDGKSGAAAIHGITPEISEKIGMTEEIAFDAFLDLVAVADTVCGHNHEYFDNKVVNLSLQRVLKRDGFDAFAKAKSFDTIKAGAQLMRKPSKVGGFQKPKLIDLHTYLTGEGFADAHTAIADVLATRRCFYAMQALVAAKLQAQAEAAA